MSKSCEGMTKNKTPCQRMVKKGEKFCHSHKNQNNCHNNEKKEEKNNEKKEEIANRPSVVAHESKSPSSLSDQILQSISHLLKPNMKVTIENTDGQWNVQIHLRNEEVEHKFAQEISPYRHFTNSFDVLHLSSKDPKLNTIDKTPFLHAFIPKDKVLYKGIKDKNITSIQKYASDQMQKSGSAGCPYWLGTLSTAQIYGPVRSLRVMNNLRLLILTEKHVFSFFQEWFRNHDPILFHLFSIVTGLKVQKNELTYILFKDLRNHLTSLESTMSHIPQMKDVIPSIQKKIEKMKDSYVCGRVSFIETDWFFASRFFTALSSLVGDKVFDGYLLPESLASHSGQTHVFHSEIVLFHPDRDVILE